MVLMPKQLSPLGETFIQEMEGGFRPQMYPDAGGYSIGYGCYLSQDEVGQYTGRTITGSEGLELFHSRVLPVVGVIQRNVHVDLTQYEFDALVSLTYNIGAGAFLESTLIRYLNRSRRDWAADQFDVWVYSGHKLCPDLRDRRRPREKKLFKTGQYK